MKRTIVGFAVVCLFVACTRERPPPRVCEAPPPSHAKEKKEEIRIGTCPVEWGSDSGVAGTDALGTTSELDAHSDG